MLISHTGGFYWKRHHLWCISWPTNGLQRCGKVLSMRASINKSNSYAWDCENRLIKVTYPGTGNYSTFAYDGFSRNEQILEYASSTLTSTKNFVWDPKVRCEARNSSGTITAQFFNLGETISGTKYFWCSDRPGSVCGMTGVNGTPVSSRSYDMFGRVAAANESVTPDFGYAGYYLHVPSGLNLANHRAFASAQGRWISRDPLGELLDTNAYDYMSNNPTMGTDPTGLCPCEIDWDQVRNAANAGAGVGAVIGGYIGGTGGFAGGLMAGGVGAVPGGVAGAGLGASGLGAVTGFAAGGANLAGQLMNAMSGSSQSSGNVQKNPQGNNSSQNDMAQDAIRNACKQRGKELTKKIQRGFHNWISNKGIGPDELDQAAQDYLEQAFGPAD